VTGSSAYFGVLGPLSVTGPDGPIDVGGRRARALLCWLLLHANEPVGVATTIAVLWNGAAPATACGRIQRLVRQLNAALGADVIEVGPRLRLRAEAERIDVTRFERMAGRAEQDLRAGRSEDALVGLRNTIALWRGPPYQELDHALPAIGPVDRLTERYLTCLENLNGLLLAGPVDFRLVADLRAATVLHPERTRLRCQLALALYRTGRQIDALTTLRELIDDSVGAGVTTRQAAELQSAILRHDPRLTLGELRPR
jgi:DNA-binding SARP family transcriptional activator